LHFSPHRPHAVQDADYVDVGLCLEVPWYACSMYCSLRVCVLVTTVNSAKTTETTCQTVVTTTIATCCLVLSSWWADSDYAVWGADLRGPKEPCIKEGFILAPSDEYHGSICAVAMMRTVVTITIATCCPVLSSWWADSRGPKEPCIR